MGAARSRGAAELFAKFRRVFAIKRVLDGVEILSHMEAGTRAVGGSNARQPIVEPEWEVGVGGICMLLP